MEPFFFESESDRLFGVYHPASDVMSRKAVVVCPPLFSEYYRTYRAIAKLSETWARKGLHVLRFDYAATGDSTGLWSKAGPLAWQKNILAAINELSEISGSDQISIAGVRLGASLAVLAAKEHGQIQNAVLWDPIWKGSAYLDSLRRTHERLINSSHNLSIHDSQIVRETELAAFSMEDWITSELPAVNICDHPLTGIGRMNIALSNASLTSDEFDANCKNSGIDFTVKVLPSDCDWRTLTESALQVPDIMAYMQTSL